MLIILLLQIFWGETRVMVRKINKKKNQKPIYKMLKIYDFKFELRKEGCAMVT